MGLIYQTVHQSGEYLSSDWQTITNNMQQFAGWDDTPVNPYPNSFDDFPAAEESFIGGIDSELHLWNGRLLTQSVENIYFSTDLFDSVRYYPMLLRRSNGSWETLGDGFRSYMNLTGGRTSQLNGALSRTVHNGDIYAAFYIFQAGGSLYSGIPSTFVSGTTRLYIVKWNPDTDLWDLLTPNEAPFTFSQSGFPNYSGKFYSHDGILYLRLNSALYKYSDDEWERLVNPDTGDSTFPIGTGRSIVGGSKIFTHTVDTSASLTSYVDLSDLSNGIYDTTYKYIGDPGETIKPPPFFFGGLDSSSGLSSYYNDHRPVYRNNRLEILNYRFTVIGSSGGTFQSINFTESDQKFQFSELAADNEFAESREVITKPGVLYDDRSVPTSYERSDSVEYILFSRLDDEGAWVYKNTSEGWINVGGSLGLSENGNSRGTITKLGNALYFSNGTVIKRTRA
jgi:hypothetical protein